MKNVKKKEIKRYEITNSLMFAAVMSDKEICKKFIERIIPGKKVEAIEIYSELQEYVETEKSIVLTPDIKNIRLDVLFKGDDEWINIEMQLSKDVNQPLRGRFYDATMTLQQIKSGDEYWQLKTNYVIFINPFDLYGKGEAVYTFCNTENKYGHDLLYGDKTYKIVVCTNNFDKAESTELKALLNYLNTGKIDESDSFVSELDHMVDKLNSPGSIWRERIMTIEELMKDKYQEGIEIGKAEGIEIGKSQGIEIGKSQGIEIGKKEANINNAKNMKDEGLSIDSISRCTGLTIEEIEKL